MTFWELAFNRGWATEEQLRLIVKTDSNQSGEMSPEEFKEITGVDF